MAILIQIRNKVDTFLADLWVNTLVPKEGAYFAKHGRYAQVLVSPTTIVADDGTGTFVKRPPSDEQFASDFTFEIVSPVPAQIEIVNHDNGANHGFTAHVYVVVLGKTYHRAKNYKFGSLDIPWHEVVPINIITILHG